jgi:SAM-dependent methyltransferase
MKLHPQDLEKIAHLTLEHYNQHAEEFWEGTRDHNVSQNIEGCCSISRVSRRSRYSILAADQGATSRCLPNKVTSRSVWKAPCILQRWHVPTAPATLDFLKLELPEKYFDGVFANAALFHVPRQELPRVLLELHTTQKPGGVLFSSNPRGRNEEGWNSGRYGVYYDHESWSRYTSAAGFVELTHYYRPDGAPLEQQPWLASVWRRLAP